MPSSLDRSKGLAYGRMLAARGRHRLHDLTVQLRLVLLRRSSLADARKFPAQSAQAASDPNTFATFKRLPEFRTVIENLSCQQGRAYLDRALAQTPELEGLLDRFRQNDAIGSPKTCDYGEFGTFSPTTLRYVKVLSDLTFLFGSLDGRRIVEIGGGYGGQCYLTSMAAKPASYTLVDLEPVLELQRVYLSRVHVTSTEFLAADDVAGAGGWDLVISNYAFSECVRRVQRRYIERVLRRSARGYLTCNWPLPRMSLNPAQLLAAVGGSRFIPEEPVISPETAIWVWGPEVHRDAAAAV